MEHTKHSEDQFGALFVALPWQIIENICQHLPADIIANVFLKIPSLRNFIIDQYYRDKICFYLVDPDGERPLNPLYEPSPSDVIGLDNIKDFLTENHNIVPQKYSIYPDLKYTGLEELLESFQAVLSQSQRLEISFQIAWYESWPERVDPSKKLMDLIFSYRNLYLLGTWFQEGQLDSLPKHGGLEKLSIHAFGKVDWTGISLPPTLTGFELHIDTESDVENDSDLEDEFDENDPFWSETIYERDYPHPPKTKPIPYDTLYSLLWKGPVSEVWTPGVAQCPNLTELILNNCDFNMVDLLILPPTLMLLSILCDNMYSIQYDESLRGSTDGSIWPANLRVLSLTDTHITDSVFYDLSRLGWPRRLSTLVLCNNDITSLKYFFNLPETLHTLFLRDNYDLIDLNLVKDETGYRMPTLPDSLERLAMYRCKNLLWDDLYYLGSMQPPVRFNLPSKLSYLDLRGSKLDITEHLVFPPSLKTVRVRGTDTDT